MGLSPQLAQDVLSGMQASIPVVEVIGFLWPQVESRNEYIVE